MKVNKVVFPVAGLGSRFLPATKSIPKEMLPIIDKPLIQYAVDEAVDAGFSELIFITGNTKRAIQDHFKFNPDLTSKNMEFIDTMFSFLLLSLFNKYSNQER